MAHDPLYEEVYALLLRRAVRLAAHGGVDPASLVHEGYLRLQGREDAFESREHFCAVAAKAMRQIVVDRARRVASAKRGGGWERVTLRGVGAEAIDVLGLDEALAELERLDPRQAEVVVMRFFGGLTVEQIGAQLGVSRSTVESDWRKARAFLALRLRA